MKMQELIDVTTRPIEDLMNGKYKVYIKSKKNNIDRSWIYICRHCEYCSEPYFRTASNDKNSAIKSMKRKNLKIVPAICSKKCAFNSNSSINIHKKIWDNYKDVLKIKESINDNTLKVTIRGKIYKRKNIPKSYINHFSNKNKTLAFKRWIDKLFYHNKMSEKLSKVQQNKIEKENQKLELKTQKIEYWDSEEGKKEKKLKKLEKIEKRRVMDMKRYYSNPIKHSLKRLLLHCVKASIKNKPYDNSNNIINYEKCIKHLKNNAEMQDKSIKEMKYLGYHIDHIIPISLYDTNDPKELSKCFNPINLRWLSSKENISKGNRIRPQDLEIIKTLPKNIYPKGKSLKQFG